MAYLIVIAIVFIRNYELTNAVTLSECETFSFIDSTTGVPISNTTMVLLSSMTPHLAPNFDSNLNLITNLLTPIRNLLGPSPETTNVAYTVYPKSANDVVQSLQYILNTNKRPTVKSGGHCFADFWSNNPNGALIDLSKMKQVYKTNDGLVWIEPGNLLYEVYAKLYESYGLTVPGGICMDVGIGGHVLGGGYGFLLRRYGLLLDYVYAFEIAVVDANRQVQLITVGRNSTDPKQQDLFWALRGAGHQNFGIITKIAFQGLPQSPQKVYVYMSALTLNLDLPHDKFVDFMTKFAQFFNTNSNASSKYCDLFVMLIPMRELAVATIDINIVAFGENNFNLVEEFLQAVGLDGFTHLFVCKTMTYYQWQTYTLLRDNPVLKETALKSAIMTSTYSTNQVETMWRYLTAPEYNIANGWMLIYGWGCALGQVAPDATAFAHRDALTFISIFTMGTTGINDADLRKQWQEGFYADMFGSSTNPQMDNSMGGCYYNYPDEDLTNWQQLYFKANYPRLQQTKVEWDPTNIFHHAQSIQLP